VSRSLTSLQTRLLKIGARVVRYARTVTFELAAAAISHEPIQDLGFHPSAPTITNDIMTNGLGLLARDRRDRHKRSPSRLPTPGRWRSLEASLGYLGNA
jgi:hypothetical protein